MPVRPGWRAVLCEADPSWPPRVRPCCKPRADKAPEAVGWKTIPSWYIIGDADKVIPPDIQLKFATRAKSKIYHVPGGDSPSMIAHPEVTVAAIIEAASSISR